MGKYADLFGTNPKSNLDEIEEWVSQRSHIKTSAKRIHYILNGIATKDVTVNQISDIGFVTIGEATEANRLIDSCVDELAEMKESLKPAETLIIEALHLIEGRKAGKGLRSLLIGFKTAVSPSLEEIRRRVKDMIEQAIQQFEVKIPVRVDPLINKLDHLSQSANKVFERLENTMDALVYLIATNPDKMVQDLATRRKEMFAKSSALMMINKDQLQAIRKICDQKKSFVEELKMTVVPIIDAVMRSSVITGNDDLSQISEALKKIL